MSKEKVELFQAIAKVMKDVKGIDKSMKVGSGNHSYNAVGDKDVKMVIGQSMQDHGLIILPKEYDTDLRIERWEEEQTWNGNTTMKTKQSVFVECKAIYSIIHVHTGQSIDVPGYGHGVDSQDKAAGKATTYALKQAALYSFFVPTGSIDDTDKENSNDKPVPQKKPEDNKPWLNRVDKAGNVTEQWEKLCKAIESGQVNSVDVVRKKYKVSKEVEKEINLVIELHNEK